MSFNQLQFGVNEVFYVFFSLEKVDEVEDEHQIRLTEPQNDCVGMCLCVCASVWPG